MPVVADELALMVAVEVPVPVMEVGLNVMVTPLPSPLALKVTAESNPPVTVDVMVSVPEALRSTVRDDFDEVRENPPVTAVVTVRLTVVVSVVPPLVPVTVMG